MSDAPEKKTEAKPETGKTPSGHLVPGDSALADKKSADLPKTEVKVTQPTFRVYG